MRQIRFASQADSRKEFRMYPSAISNGVVEIGEENSTSVFSKISPSSSVSGALEFRPVSPVSWGSMVGTVVRRLAKSGKTDRKEIYDAQGTDDCGRFGGKHSPELTFLNS